VIFSNNSNKFHQILTIVCVDNFFFFNLAFIMANEVVDTSELPVSLQCYHECGLVAM